MKEKTAESKPVGKLANAMLCFCALVYLIIFVPVDAWLKMVGAGASILFLFHIEATARQLIAVRKIKQLKKEIASLPQSTNYREMHGGLPELNEKLKAAEKRLKAIRTDSFEISSHSTGPR